MHLKRLRNIVTITALILLPAAPVTAQQGPAGCAWNKYLYAQDATQQGKIDTNLLRKHRTM